MTDPNDRELREQLKRSELFLQDLVEALDGAFISSWQSTAAWDKQLNAARNHLELVQLQRAQRVAK